MTDWNGNWDKTVREEHDTDSDSEELEQERREQIDRADTSLDAIPVDFTEESALDRTVKEDCERTRIEANLPEGLETQLHLPQLEPRAQTIPDETWKNEPAEASFGAVDTEPERERERGWSTLINTDDPPTDAPKDQAEHMKLAPELSGKTVLDLAAALGMAPEPIDKSRGERSESEVEAKDRRRTDLSHKPRDPEKPRELDFGQLVKGAPRNRPAPDLEALQDAAHTTNAAAKVIPYIIISFLVVATLFTSGLMFTSVTPPTTMHIEMSILPMRKLGQRRDPIPTKIQLFLTTEPEGVIVMYRGESLGRTPIKTEISASIDEKGVFRIESPYFETLVQEVSLNLLGEIHLDVELIPRD